MFSHASRGCRGRVAWDVMSLVCLDPPSIFSRPWAHWEAFLHSSYWVWALVNNFHVRMMGDDVYVGADFWPQATWPKGGCVAISVGNVRKRREEIWRWCLLYCCAMLCFTCSVCPPFSSRYRWQAVVSTYRVNPQDRWWSIRWSLGSITRSLSIRNQRYQIIKSSHSQAGTLPLLWVNSSFDGQLPQPWPQSGNTDSQGAGVSPGVDIRYDILQYLHDIFQNRIRCHANWPLDLIKDFGQSLKMRWLTGQHLHVICVDLSRICYTVQCSVYIYWNIIKKNNILYIEILIVLLHHTTCLPVHQLNISIHV